MSLEDTCSICGGEGRIKGAWNRTTSCPACHGSGKKGDVEPLIRDVTKTKPSHYETASSSKAKEKQTWPSTAEGVVLATEVRADGELDVREEVLAHHEPEVVLLRVLRRSLETYPLTLSVVVPASLSSRSGSISRPERE